MSSNKNSPNNTPPGDSRSSSNASSSLAVNTTVIVPPSIAINPPSSSSNTATSNSTRTPPSVPASSKSNNTNNTNTNNNPRYNPPVPSRMSGTYSSNNSIYKVGGNSSVHRLSGTRSANNSPPGTPPNGLRDYYINAALQRSGHHRLHPVSLPSSSSNLQQQQQQQQQTRPSISILVPQPQSQNTLVPEATVARRSYSADHLTINEPEITVTTPGGSNATEEHVMTLEAALNNLIEKEGRGNTAPGTPENEEDSVEYDEPIMMRGSIPESSSKRDSSNNRWSKGFSTFNSNSNSHSNSGISLTPKVLANRFETEGTTTAAQDLTDNKEKRLSEKDKEKKKNRISKLFHREGSSTPAAVPEVQYNIRPPVQPSKAGVLSNLLKLQGKHTHDKVTLMSYFVLCRAMN